MNENSTIQPTKSLEELYLNGNYDSLYQKFLNQKKEFPRGVFHYNLGTVQAKKGEFAWARYHLEKSIKNGFTHPKVFKNLKIVKNNIQVLSAEDNLGLFDNGLNQLLLIPSHFFLTLTLILVIILTFLKTQQIIKSWGVSFLLLFLTIIPYLFSIFYLNNLNYGIIVKNDFIYEGPSKVYEKLDQAPVGLKVLVETKKNGWSFIKSPLEYSGWIKVEMLALY